MQMFLYDFILYFFSYVYCITILKLSRYYKIHFIYISCLQQCFQDQKTQNFPADDTVTRNVYVCKVMIVVVILTCPGLFLRTSSFQRS